jgi:hypothetical protein
MHRDAAIVGQVNGGQRSAVIYGSQPSGVTVGKYIYWPGPVFAVCRPDDFQSGEADAVAVVNFELADGKSGI